MTPQRSSGDADKFSILGMPKATSKSTNADNEKSNPSDKKTEGKKPEAKKGDVKKAEVKKAEPKKDAAKKAEAAKPTKVDSKKTDKKAKESTEKSAAKKTAPAESAAPVKSSASTKVQPTAAVETPKVSTHVISILDLPEVQEKIRELIKLAKEQGYLTFDDLNEALPDNVSDPDEMDSIMNRLRGLEIDIIDA